MNSSFELLAPAGDFASLEAAIQGGCQAVYFGLQEGWNMRQSANNFALRHLPKIMQRCKEVGIKGYLTLNTLVFETERRSIEKILDKVKSNRVDAVIAWDPLVIILAREKGIPVHLSTQASIANAQSIAFYYQTLGVQRVILARECQLTHIHRIHRYLRQHGMSRVELECFVHGAMCLAISGRCFLSHAAYGWSGNRGECLQACRRRYRVIEIDGEAEYEITQSTVLSPKDLCALPFLDQLIRAGIRCFKIEGRNRGPDYVYTVTRVYRQVLEAYQNYRKKRISLQQYHDQISQGMDELSRVYNRGFSSGFYLGLPDPSDWSPGEGNQSSFQKVFVGEVENFYRKPMVAAIRVQNRGIRQGEEIMIIGPTTGVVRTVIQKMERDHLPIQEAFPGGYVGFVVPQKVRRHDKVYVIERKISPT